MVEATLKRTRTFLKSSGDKHIIYILLFLLLLNRVTIVLIFKDSYIVNGLLHFITSGHRCFKILLIWMTSTTLRIVKKSCLSMQILILLQTSLHFKPY